jgi:hypothetical protein
MTSPAALKATSPAMTEVLPSRWERPADLGALHALQAVTQERLTHQMEAQEAQGVQAQWGTAVFIVLCMGLAWGMLALMGLTLGFALGLLVVAGGGLFGAGLARLMIKDVMGNAQGRIDRLERLALSWTPMRASALRRDPLRIAQWAQIPEWEHILQVLEASPVPLLERDGQTLDELANDARGVRQVEAEVAGRATGGRDRPLNIERWMDRLVALTRPGETEA